MTPKPLPRADTVEEEIANHMRPDVLWVEDPEFERAFNERVRETQTEHIPMAAHTNQVDPRTGKVEQYPGFVNIRFENRNAIVTVRGDPPLDSEGVATGDAADTVTVTFEQTDWDQFVAEATRERGLVPGG